MDGRHGSLASLLGDGNLEAIGDGDDAGEEWDRIAGKPHRQAAPVPLLVERHDGDSDLRTESRTCRELRSAANASVLGRELFLIRPRATGIRRRIIAGRAELGSASETLPASCIRAA